MPAEMNHSGLIIPGQEVRSSGPILNPIQPINTYHDYLFVPLITTRGEFLLRTDRLVEAQDFLDDNHSALAQEKIDRWNKNYKSGRSYIRVGCADARPIYDEEHVWNQRSIAAGFPNKELYALTYISGVRAVIVDTHYGNFEFGKRPTGCGGQDTRANMRANGIPTNGGGLLGLVGENIHEDPIYNGIEQARKIVREIVRKRGEGKVFVTTQDHHTGILIPVAEYTIKDGVQKRTIPIEYIDLAQAREEDLEKIYNPAEIYQNGIPHLPEDGLSPEFKEYLRITNEKRLSLLQRYPDLSQRQEVQNPWALIITTNKIDTRNRFPKLLGNPGDFFELDVPGLKAERIVTVPDEAIEAAIHQIRYAIDHANQNHDHPNAAFAKSKTLIVDTGSIHQSQHIVRRLLQEDWAQQWVGLGGKIFVAATGKSGRLEKIEPFTPTH